MSLWITICAGLIMGSVFELGERGLIANWGHTRRDDRTGGILALMMLGMVVAFISGYADTWRGVTILFLIWLGAFKLAQIIVLTTFSR